ncbi:hypothetical protein [Arthrobacter sp. 4R501]|nr:hypothetical protein [Arthrobacter sp. 4R501]
MSSDLDTLMRASTVSSELDFAPQEDGRSIKSATSDAEEPSQDGKG